MSISVIRYSAAFLDWTKEETKELDRWTRKHLIAGRALQIKSNVMRIHIKLRYEGRGLIKALQKRLPFCKLKQFDCWTRKQLIAGRALTPKSNVMRIHIKRR